MLIWRRGRFRFTRSALACLLGLIFGLSGSAMFSSIGGIPRSFLCDSSRRDTKEPNLLLVGVMTAAKYVDTRAYNVWKTWAQYIPGKIIFFVAENVHSIHEDLPLISLKGVTDVYPPQKKSFAMLKWMADNHLNDFDWFLRADDDLYVRGDHLEKFLRSLDSDKAQMIGQAGLGNVAEYGQLALGMQDNYCMGGPGVIISRETLRTVAPHLQSCLREMLTPHEDVELGRCIRKHVGVACTWNYEMRTLFHNNQTIPEVFENGTNEFRRAITLHPIKQPIIMRRVHATARSITLNSLREKKVALSNELHRTQSTSLIRHIPRSTNDLKYWDYISANNILFCSNQVNCPRHTLDLSIKTAVNEVITKLFEEFNSNSRIRGRILQFQKIHYGYMRVEPRYGVNYILDMILWFKKFRPPNRATLSVRRHAYIQQTFQPVQAISDDIIRERLRQRIDKKKRKISTNTTMDSHLISTLLPVENPHVNIVLPLSGRADTFKRFASHLRNVCADRSTLSLIVVYFQTGTQEDEIIYSTISQLKSDIDVKVIEMGMVPFSRGLALGRGAESLSSEDLMFFTDVDIIFTCDALNRLRLNTIFGAQIYFPIVFSEYAPENWSDNDRVLSDAFHYGRRRGYFRHFGFGIVSLYKTDLDFVGGLNMNIQGWGLEDVDLFEKFIRSPLRILRAPDPGLVHIYHPIHCSESMPQTQYAMCIGSKAASMASLDSLVDQISIYS